MIALGEKMCGNGWRWEGPARSRRSQHSFCGPRVGGMSHCNVIRLDSWTKSSDLFQTGWAHGLHWKLVLWRSLNFTVGRGGDLWLVIMRGMAPMGSLHSQGGGKWCWDDCHGDWSVPRILCDSHCSHSPRSSETNKHLVLIVKCVGGRLV